MASASFAPLRHRNFTLTLLSSFVSSIGTWMQSVGMGVWLTLTTHNPVWLGLVMLTTWLPAIVGSPLGGIVADRWHRQRWIQINNACMAIGAATLATLELTHHLTPLEVCVIGLVEGLCGSSSWAAYQGLLPDLVGRDEVLAAVSLSSGQFNLGRIIGPTAAGIALAWGSPGLCFAVNAASFVFVVVVFAFVRAPARPAPETPLALLRELREGFEAARVTPGCRRPIVLVSIFSFVISPFIALIPAMAIDVLHAGKTGTSWMVVAQGVGAVVAVVWLPNLATRTSRLTVLRGSLLVLAVGDLLYGVAPNLAWSMAALFVAGGAYVGLITGLNSSVQLHAPTALRSRVIALYTMSLSIWYPLGTLLQSAFAHHVGVRTVTVVSAIVGLALGLVVTSGQPSYLSAVELPAATEAVGLAD